MFFWMKGVSFTHWLLNILPARINPKRILICIIGFWFASWNHFWLKCVWSKISFSVFWKFELNVLWFALKNGLLIAQPNCPITWPDDVVLQTRPWDCNMILHVLAIHNFNVFIFFLENINILVPVWRFRETTQFRVTRHVVSPWKPFLVSNSVHNIMSQDEIDHFLAKIEQFSAPKSRLFVLF